MRVAVTGTPGTGKTSATELLAEREAVDLDVVHLNEVVREEGLATERDEARDSLIVDPDVIEDWLGDRDDVLFESHLAHTASADRVVVLRTHPAELETRLQDRGEDERTARENAESEALDVILSAAVERHGADAVYEIDATDRSPEDVADAIEAVVDGSRSSGVGTVDFLDWLEPSMDDATVDEPSSDDATTDTTERDPDEQEELR